MPRDINMEPSWNAALAPYCATDAFQTLSEFVRSEYLSKTVYPPPADVFRAFWLTPFESVQVVILGQDPYHGPGQAHGLSFSVPAGVRLPPSLQNIYKELEQDLGIKKDFANGDLTPWAHQGVFLLNAMLTVIARTPASHQGKGWEGFTDMVIGLLSRQREHLVFMLWGNFARSKKALIDTSKHLVLEAPHPSPFSAHSGFFGCKHFSKCNAYLREHNPPEIAW